MTTLYDIAAETIDGKTQKLADYAGKVLLIVNVASKCGFTPQYEGLEALYRKFGKDDFAVLAFPAINSDIRNPVRSRKLPISARRITT